MTSFSIYNLSGYFDGYDWIEGPITITVDNNIISEITKEKKLGDFDAKGKFLSVPFTDGHTHLIFAGDRSFELDMKLQGSNYAEILESGGGIYNTVNQTRNVSDDLLETLLIERLDKMMARGTLIVEVKSGYGLNVEEELRQLRILNKVNKIHPIEVIPTFCGAHALPNDKSRSEYVDDLISMIPKIKNDNLATSNDVFCDRGAFSNDETETILSASLDSDLPVKVHAEELEYRGIGKIAAEKYNALSADHLLMAKKDDFKILAEHNTTAMFMPAATIGLFTNQKPEGWNIPKLNIGLGSDYNPNNLVLSMQTAIRLAVFLYRMRPIDSFRAATSGSYQGVTGNNFSKLKEGSIADFILINAESIDQLVTRFDENLVQDVIKDGKVLRSTNINLNKIKL